MEKETFKQLVRSAESHATSDLAYEVRGLLLFAEQRASEEEIEEFMEWLGDDQDLFSIVPQNSEPRDHFECAQLLTWEDMRETWMSPQMNKTRALYIEKVIMPLVKEYVELSDKGDLGSRFNELENEIEDYYVALPEMDVCAFLKHKFKLD